MAHGVKKRVADLLFDTKKHEQSGVLFAFLALFVSIGVVVTLRQYGIAANTTQQVLDCNVQGVVAHTHDESCYDAAGNLVCTLPERELHVHDDSCYTETSTLICGLEESEGHTHDETCYDAEGYLICGLDESTGHVHTDACYQVSSELTCGKEEVTEEHVHGPGCFREIVVDDGESEMPEQTFSHQFEDADGTLVLGVDVKASEGSLPAGSSMKVEMLDDTKVDHALVQSALDARASEHGTAAGKLLNQRAVNIAFFDANGAEVEPSSDVTVIFTSALVNGVETSAVVGVESDQQASARAEREGASEYEIGAKVLVKLDKKSLASHELSLGANQLAVDARGYATYVLATTSRALEMQAEGESERVLVQAPAEAGIPQGSTVRVAEVAPGTEEYATYEAQALNAVSAGHATLARFFDITIVGPDGAEIQPQAPVSVKVKLADAPADAGKPTVVHFSEDIGEQTPELIPSTVVKRTTTFEAASFSVYGVVYTTDVLTADGERFHIAVTYADDAEIPAGSVLVAKEIAEGTAQYEACFDETVAQWEEADRRDYVSFCRFFDIEIQKDGQKIEPKAPVQVEIRHEDGFAPTGDESLSVIHFADNGTEIIGDITRSEDSTKVAYEQDSFSVIGTVSTVKNSGWPTANGQYVLVLQDGEDYYALKQDGSLAKVRYFNDTVSFIGEGTTTTDYINDYLWYVTSGNGATARGYVSNEYYESGSSVESQMFIAPSNDGWLINSARQLRFNAAERKLYYTYYNVSRTLSAHDGQLSVVALNDSTASPVFFAAASSFTANDNETDLFTQEEVESIVDKWKQQKTQTATCDKTAEVYDYENRIYRVDIEASSSDYEVSPSIALEFVVDASRSMFFPTSVTEVATFSGTNASSVRNWINSHGDRNQVYFVIQNKNGAATQFAIFYDPNSGNGGQWLWCDASVYNPPDDRANGGTEDSRQGGLPLSTWNYGSLDDGKIYTTSITGTSSGTYGERKTWISRIEYLKQCVRVAAQVIYAVDDNAQIGLVGFNAKVKDYGTYGKSEQQDLLNALDDISLSGGTNHQAGLQEAINKYQNAEFYAEHYAGRKHVVVLVTDGAPNQTGVTWTTIGNTATTLKNLEDDFGGKTELYTMGLSLTNVGSNQSNLFNVSSGEGYTYAAEDAAQIINAVTKMVDGIFVQANLIADVKDVIDPAFYPVDARTGQPLAENEWINLDGQKVAAGSGDAVGQVKKDTTTGNWYVEWKDQEIDWPTTNSSGAVEAPGWHGAVFVKAKEDFLGGNGINTNAEGSQLQATKYIVRGDKTGEQHNLSEGDHIRTFETPYVNVDELDITKNDTEWTVYLGTNVDPLAEVKALWDQVKVREVVTKTDADHRMASDGQLTYTYASNANDNRAEANGREEFPITDLDGVTLTDDDWNALIAGEIVSFPYSAYDHLEVGTISLKLTQNVASGEKDLTESPHDTTVTGTAVERYSLSVRYQPAGASSSITNWHTGSYGSGKSGNRAGTITKASTHTINVYVKGLQITKVNLDDQVLLGAKFALYRTARDGETDVMTIGGGQYCKVADLDTSATGIAVKEQIEQLEAGEQYYLVETEVPAGYHAISPIPVSLNITDTYTPKPGTATQTTKPESGIYNWQQNASLVLDTKSGVKRTDADNTVDLTHVGADGAQTETIYYRITNNPGHELPDAGGPGTLAFYTLGFGLLAAAGTLLLKERRA